METDFTIFCTHSLCYQKCFAAIKTTRTCKFQNQCTLMDIQNKYCNPPDHGLPLRLYIEQVYILVDKSYCTYSHFYGKHPSPHPRQKALILTDMFFYKAASWRRI
jgi:hypothetical protein